MSLKTMSMLMAASRNDSQYADPRWHSFSNRIRREKNNSCDCCRRGDQKTSVHHKYYDSRRKLWEYATDEVLLLCETCHTELHHELKQFRRHTFGFLSPQAFHILNAALSVAAKEYDPLTFAHAMAEFVSTPSLVRRYAEAWGRDEKGNQLAA